MRCLHCRRQIGAIRRLVDREFCSADHRRRFRSTSARALRDAGELMTDYDDYLAVKTDTDRKPNKANTKLSLLSAGMIGLVVGICLWIVPSSPVPIQTKEIAYDRIGSNRVTEWLKSFIPDTPKINLRHDFRMGVGDWMGTPTQVAGALRTDNVRLWKPTLRLADYQMEFQAAIEQRAVSWAFRATDVQSYYATKLIAGADGSRAEIERFVILGGREMDRVRLPIPVAMRPDTLYRIRMRVKGDQFTTSVDGQVVDTWRDRRLRRGGVGFFSERGETASVRWVSLSEPDGFLSRLLAMGFIVHPLYGTGMLVLPGVPADNQ